MDLGDLVRGNPDIDGVTVGNCTNSGAEEVEIAGDLAG